MIGWLDISDTSSSDPGQTTSLSPYCNMTSLYFDDSLYENKMHYKIAKYLDENPLGEDYDELRIVCDNEEQYNQTLDALFKAGEGKLKMYGVSINPMEIIVEKDPRENYRQFDENMLMDNDVTEE